MRLKPVDGLITFSIKPTLWSDFLSGSGGSSAVARAMMAFFINADLETKSLLIRAGFRRGLGLAAISGSEANVDRAAFMNEHHIEAVDESIDALPVPKLPETQPVGINLNK